MLITKIAYPKTIAYVQMNGPPRINVQAVVWDVDFDVFELFPQMDFPKLKILLRCKNAIHLWIFICKNAQYAL